MSRKLISFALPLSAVLLFSAARPSLAATPITTFGVMATVEAGCSISASTLHGTYSTAMENAASSVSVNCTNIAQYVITVSSLASTATGEAATVPVGNRNFPLASLMNYAMPSTLGRNIKSNLTAAAGPDNSTVQPLFAYSGTAGMPAGAPAPGPDTISISITY